MSQHNLYKIMPLFHLDHILHQVMMKWTTTTPNNYLVWCRESKIPLVFYIQSEEKGAMKKNHQVTYIDFTVAQITMPTAKGTICI